MQDNDTTPEVWRDVVGYEGWYSVSDLGRVRRARTGINTYVGRILRPRANTHGYLSVVIGRKSDGSRKTHPVHRLVMQSFVGMRPSGHEANHRNGIKTDNALNNLEYIPAGDNQRHAFALGLKHPPHGHEPKGETNGNAKLTEADVRIILNSDESHAALGKRYGVTLQAIALIRRGVNWKHISR